MKKPTFKTIEDELVYLEYDQKMEYGGLEYQEAIRWRMAQLEASKNGYWKDDEIDEEEAEEEEFVVRKKSKRYINYWDE